MRARRLGAVAGLVLAVVAAGSVPLGSVVRAVSGDVVPLEYIAADGTCSGWDAGPAAFGRYDGDCPGMAQLSAVFAVGSVSGVTVTVRGGSLTVTPVAGDPVYASIWLVCWLDSEGPTSSIISGAGGVVVRGKVAVREVVMDPWGPGPGSCFLMGLDSYSLAGTVYVARARS